MLIKTDATFEDCVIWLETDDPKRTAEAKRGRLEDWVKRVVGIPAKWSLEKQNAPSS